MKPKVLILTLLAVVFSFSANATHTSGGIITYRAIDTFKFEVTYAYLRDCRGIAFTNPTAACYVRCATGGTVGLSLTLVSIEEITPLASGIKGGCVPENTYGTGEGIERHVYKDTAPLNTTGQIHRDINGDAYLDKLTGDLVLKCLHTCSQGALFKPVMCEHPEMSFGPDVDLRELNVET